jgi:hypothetical protein
MHRLWILARSILLGWASLFAVTYLIERPLLYWTAPLLGGSWFPTAQLAFECVALAAIGWMIGRWNRSDTVPVVLVFAAMLAVWNFGLVPAINIPWLFRLMVDSFGSARYLESLVTAAVTHAFLFGSLFVGAWLSRPRQTTPVSIVSGRG